MSLFLGLKNPLNRTRRDPAISKQQLKIRRNKEKICSGINATSYRRRNAPQRQCARQLPPQDSSPSSEVHPEQKTELCTNAQPKIQVKGRFKEK